jgi:hypothetical protein
MPIPNQKYKYYDEREKEEGLRVDKRWITRKYQSDSEAKKNGERNLHMRFFCGIFLVEI